MRVVFVFGSKTSFAAVFLRVLRYPSTKLLMVVKTGSDFSTLINSGFPVSSFESVIFSLFKNSDKSCSCRNLFNVTEGLFLTSNSKVTSGGKEASPEAFLSLILPATALV